MGRSIEFNIPEDSDEFFTDTFENEEGEEETEQVKHLSICLGSGDAWPVYLRVFMISAYLREQAEKNTQFMNLLLKICPIHCNESQITGDLMSLLFSRMQANNDMLNFNYILQHADDLKYRGLYPFVYLAKQYKYNVSLTINEIREISKMFNELQKFVPYHKEDLKYSPYYEVADEPYNLADERWEDVIKGFNEASKKTNIITHFY